MSEISARAQIILTWIQSQNLPTLVLRQASLAEQFGCSRRTIGRALKQLIAAGLLVDLNKRAENRCKIYQVQTQIEIPPNPPLQRGEEIGLTPEAQTQWERYHKTFALVFKMPNLETYYAQVTWELAGIKNESELYSKTFAGLFELSA